MSREDFVKVRLNALGAKLAGNHPLVINGSQQAFTFKAGEEQEVTRVLDWERFLSQEHHDGEPIFELVPEVAVKAEPKVKFVPAADAAI